MRKRGNWRTLAYASGYWAILVRKLLTVTIRAKNGPAMDGFIY